MKVYILHIPNFLGFSIMVLASLCCSQYQQILSYFYLDKGSKVLTAFIQLVSD